MSSAQTQPSRKQLLPEQQTKFISWCAFSVLTPLTALTVVAFIAWLQGTPSDIISLLAKGDTLLLGIVLLAMALDWSFQAYRNAPRKTMEQDVVSYIWPVATLLILLWVTVFYGWVVTQNLPSTTPTISEPIRAIVASCLFLMIVVACGLQYYQLLLLKRL